jgi:ectoine hydroxylase-related dioxygenase (phytanoyl-CoA dioxygenase family)
MTFDYSSQRLPPIESPFFDEMVDKSAEHSDLMLKLNDEGYCVFDLKIDPELLVQANADIDVSIQKNSFKKNSAAYHYNDSPRIVEAWKDSDAIKEIATNKKLLSFLKYAYQSDPVPFSTINFLKGTEQPLHSDEFHFGSIPHRYLTGVWVALEDVDPDSGPLSLAIGSHKMPIFSFEMLNIEIPKNEREFKKAYTIYEEWAREYVKCQDLQVVTPELKKGQCIIWLSNTLHGAFKIKNNALTRKSMAIHFHYEKCEKIFFPSYSNIEKGKFVPRSLTNLDIRAN